MKKFEGMVPLTLKVNGEEKTVFVPSNKTLLRVLREEWGDMGPKPGCENGDCGACTIVLNGEQVKSCLILAVEASGMEIQTISGIGNPALRSAFVEENGLQCGYCTPGVFVNLHCILEEKTPLTKEEESHRLRSNICRCTGYEGITRTLERAKREKGKNSSFL